MDQSKGMVKHTVLICLAHAFSILQFEYPEWDSWVPGAWQDVTASLLLNRSWKFHYPGSSVFSFPTTDKALSLLLLACWLFQELC